MDTFRKLGVVVVSLHEVGKGLFDLIVAVDFLNILVEVKDGRKAPSSRQLTDDQKDFNFYWTGLRAIATSPFDVSRIVSEARELVSLFRASAKTSGVAIAVCGSRESMYQPALTS